MNDPLEQPTAKTLNPWPIGIALFFVVFIGFLAWFIALATRQHIDLVRSDYYEEEIRFQKQLDRVVRSEEIDRASIIAYDQETASIRITLPTQPAAVSSGRIQLYRPSNAALDQLLKLALGAGGTQYVDAKHLVPGLWKVRIRWTTDGKEYYLDRSVVIPGGPKPAKPSAVAPIEAAALSLN